MVASPAYTPAARQAGLLPTPGYTLSHATPADRQTGSLTLRLTVRSTTDTSRVGTRNAMPVSLPARGGAGIAATGLEEEAAWQRVAAPPALWPPGCHSRLDCCRCKHCWALTPTHQRHKSFH